MKKFFSKILIATFVLSFFLAPIQNINGQTPTEIWWYEYVRTTVNGDVRIKSPSNYSTSTECEAARAAYQASGIPTVVVDSACKTGTPPTTTTPQVGNAAVINVTPNEENYNYGCDFWPGTWHLCIMSWIYQLIFQPIAFFARLSAQILDFFIYYSISSDSYTSNFIEKGWGIMRDIANVFFIIALIYVAVKTILDLSTSNNKRMIGMIIIVALLINFSLFATKVVIDASNILARVFYSNIESVDKHGVVKPAEDGGEKSITVGLVKQFNPHIIFGTNSGSSISDNPGTFAAILFLSILMMGYMVFMFLSVTLLFVSRVVMLWILMIMSPIAFISMTMPGVKIPSFNFSEWWDQLSDNAFLAPIFIFFLYLIITFGDVVKVVTGNDSASIAPVGGGSLNGADDATFAKYMDVVIPFILIFILLATAKEIAVKMSGKMGSMINKAGAVVGGLAIGAATGGAALVATNTLGKGSALMNSKFGERLRDIGTKKIKNEDGTETIVKNTGLGAYFARQGLKTFDKGTKASFDVRKTALGSQVSKFTGLNFQSASGIGLGSKEGGFAGANERKAKEIEKDKELYKTNMSDKETREYTLTRSLNYEKEKAEAIQKAVGNKTGQEKIDAEGGALLKFIALRGEAPKVHNKTDDLNKERMLAFKDSIGKTGLLSAVSTSTVSAVGAEISQVNYTVGKNGTAYREALRRKKKKEAREKAILEGKAWDEKAWDEDNKDLSKLDIGKYDAVLGKQINERRSQRVKMGIGATAAALGGGFGGAAVLGSVGSMASAVGAQFAGASVLGGGLASGAVAGGITLATVEGDQYGSTLAENKVRESMEKETKEVEKKAVRIKETEKRLDKHQESVLNAYTDIQEKFKDPTTGQIAEKDEFMKIKKVIDEKTGQEKQVLESIDNKKLSEQISRVATENDQLTSRLTSLTQNITDSKNKLQEAIVGQDRAKIAALTTNIQRMEGTLNAEGNLEGGELQDVMAKKQITNLKINQLQGLQGIEDKIYSTRKELSELTGKKLEEGGSSSNTPAPAAPSTPPPATP